MTLYETLGVTPEATQSEIHDAYIRMARAMHPDTNGGQDSEEFRVVKDAHDVLYDTEKRQIYDETGLVKGDPAQSEELRALGVIKKYMAQAMAQPERSIPEVIRGAVLNDLAGVEQQIFGVNEAITSFGRVRSNIESRWKSSDRLKVIAVATVDQGIEQSKTQLAVLENQTKPLKRALEMLADVRYEMPEPEMFTARVWRTPGRLVL